MCCRRDRGVGNVSWCVWNDRPHRPAPYADLTGFIDAAGGVAPSSRAEIAAATAALLRAGRTRAGGDDDRFVALVDRVGIDTLGALWRDSDPVSLPGALWALYLLRQWCAANAEQVRLLWRAGAPLAPADAAVAGVGRRRATSRRCRRGADAILAGVYRGDLAVALERAAAFFRVLAAGRRDRADGARRRRRARRRTRARPARNERVGDRPDGRGAALAGRHARTERRAPIARRR